MRNKHHNFIPANYFNTVPAFFLSIGLLSGILLAYNLPQIFFLKLNSIIIITIIIPLLLLSGKSIIISVFASIFAGFLLQNIWQTNQEFDENYFNNGDTIQIYAEFYSPPNYRDEKEMTQQTTISGSDYRINLILKNSLTDSIIIPGEQAKITGVFRKFDTKNTAAPWEYDRIFQDRIKNCIGDIEVISAEKSIKNPFAAKLHNYISKKFENTRYNSLYISLFLGDRSFVTQDIKSFFQESGLVHFLSVSGMHIAIIISTFTIITYFLPLPFLIRQIIIALLILSLPLVVGFGPATLRAVIMGIILVLSPLFNRINNSLNSLFTACFLILTIYPMHFFLIGFQYSFVATFGILILWQILENKEHGKTIFVLTLPILMFLLTTPIQIYHFGTITLSSPICNLLILPIFEFICNLSLLSLLIPIDVVSQLLLDISDGILDIAFFIINKFIIFTGLGEEYASVSPLWFVAIIISFFTYISFQKHKVIYITYASLLMTVGLLVTDLLKRDTVYTVSSQNFRMKLFDTANPVAVIVGGAQTKLFYNNSFRRWLKKHLDGGFFTVRATPLIISGESYIPADFLKEYNLLRIRNATGEIRFDNEKNEYATERISTDEKKSRRSNTAKLYYEYKI